MKAKIETGSFKIEVEADRMLESLVFEKVESFLRLLVENSIVVVKDTEEEDGKNTRFVPYKTE